MGSRKIESLVDNLPVPFDDIVGWGVSWFIDDQDPNKVKFQRHSRDGELVAYSIKVYTDEENIEEAEEYWKNWIEGKL